MLSNSKSSFFNLKVFSILSDKRKLELIKYNKNLQKNLDINIIHYKEFSKRYIIYDTKEKGKGKEYDYETNHLSFEGEFLNGERNGKGKEYNIFDKLIFEGEYLNGLKNGKGKEYNDDGN